jgi:hypothetical protein
VARERQESPAAPSAPELEQSPEQALEQELERPLALEPVLEPVLEPAPLLAARSRAAPQQEAWQAE